LRLWDQAIGYWSSGIGTTKEELKARSTRAVGDTDSSGEMDEIASGEVMKRESINTIIDTVVGWEDGFDTWEDEHGTVSTSTGGFDLTLQSGKEGNPIIWTEI